MRFFLLVVILALGCRTLRPPGSAIPLDPVKRPASQWLLAPGKYQHQITLHRTDNSPEGPKDLTVLAIVDLREDLLKVTLLSEFGATLLKVAEDPAENVFRLWIYLDALKVHQSEIERYYPYLRGLLYLPRSGIKTEEFQPLESKDPMAVTEWLYRNRLRLKVYKSKTTSAWEVDFVMPQATGHVEVTPL